MSKMTLAMPRDSKTWTFRLTLRRDRLSHSGARTADGDWKHSKIMLQSGAAQQVSLRRDKSPAYSRTHRHRQRSPQATAADWRGSGRDPIDGPSEGTGRPLRRSSKTS